MCVGARLHVYICIYICVCAVHSSASSWFGSRHSSFIHSSENMIGAAVHGLPALRMKEPHVIQAWWEELFKMRRCVEKDDLKAITDSNVRADIYNTWMQKWIQENLTEQQRQKWNPARQRSICSAWLRNHYGSKRVVMDIIETGLSLSTPSGAAAGHSPDTDIAVGAPEHTITRSGEEKHTSGLTEHEKTIRPARDRERSEPRRQSQGGEASCRSPISPEIG